MPNKSRLSQFKDLLLGRVKDPLDPNVFHAIALTAFLAWVGLGADGLSSANYGPEEAFLALGDHRYLAIFLGLAVAVTVSLISASYAQIIELFPAGGGGYQVASKLVGSHVGLVAGCALVVDYILTITISVASGVDAIFSFMPLFFQSYALLTKFIIVVALIVLNLRGVKESIQALLPIFIVFLMTHAFVVLYGILRHADALPSLLVATQTQTVNDVRSLGFLPILLIFLRAYSLGGGTYTGIEAVSNGMQALREPRVQTGKRAMVYMAISLSFMAGGILVNYLLNDVRPVPGQTLNAALINKLVAGWNLAGVNLGHAFLLVSLLSAGGLLFVAAQSGFVAGPRVLANMANDSWVPHQWSHLSDRLVIKNGIYIMGLSGLAFLFLTRGKVSHLVIMYSINVFITFTLSQLGMCVHWWKSRMQSSPWVKKMTINAAGLALTSSILIVTVFEKFTEGGWLTIVITLAFVGLCLAIKHHYAVDRASLKSLDQILMDIPIHPGVKPPAEKQPGAPTAVLMVADYNGLGIHSFFSAQKLFSGHFKNFAFISAGVIDAGKFKGVQEIDNLKRTIEEMLLKYVALANSVGYPAEYYFSLGTDRIEELEKLCAMIAAEDPGAVFFCGKLIFPEENWVTRFLHNQVAHIIERRLQYDGLQVVVLPIRAIRPAKEE